MEQNIDINEYRKIFENVKQEVLKAQYKAMQKVNAELIYMYWHIGTIILENARWGNKIIDNVSIDLKLEFTKIKFFQLEI